MPWSSTTPSNTGRSSAISTLSCSTVRTPSKTAFSFPGPLREPQEALRRAHLLIRTGDPESEALCQRSRPALFPRHPPAAGACGSSNGPRLTIAELSGKKVCAFAGIGNPETFRRSLTGLGAEVTAFRAFPDHHPYRTSDLDALRRLSGENAADRIVTTEKDGIRLADFPGFLKELCLLRIGMAITPADAFAELLFSRVR